MKVFCKYNKEFDSFLKKTVKYTIDRYGQYLDVTDIEEIELRDIKDFPYETDGKTYDGGRKILVTSRLYELLPSFDIRKIKNDTETLKCSLIPNFMKWGMLQIGKECPICIMLL